MVAQNKLVHVQTFEQAVLLPTRWRYSSRTGYIANMSSHQRKSLGDRCHDMQDVVGAVHGRASPTCSAIEDPPADAACTPK